MIKNKIKRNNFLKSKRLYQGLSWALTGLLLFCSHLVFADEFNVSGYVKSYALLEKSIDIMVNNNINGANSYNVDSINTVANINNEKINSNVQSQNALRLMAAYLSKDYGNFELHYEIQPIYQHSNTSITTQLNDETKQENKTNSTLAVATNRYRVKDIDTVLAHSGQHVKALQNLDRFNYQYNHQQGDLTLGRQVISFGSARFINPSDIFIPFGIQTLNQEYRVGIDAIRYQYYLNDVTMIDMGVVVGRDAKKANSAIFLRNKLSMNGSDIETIFIQLDNAWLAGAGVERALGDFGFWFETAYMNRQKTNNYWRTSIGADYAVNNNIVLMLEYHYNGAGHHNPSHYNTNDDNYNTDDNGSANQESGVFLLGKNYLIPAISWLVTPLISINANAFININDHSTFINLSSEVSWSDNLYSDFGLYLSTGNDNLTLQTNITPPLNMASEFGAYPLSFYASLRYYF